MRPLSIHLENVGRFPTLDLDLPEGAVAVTGENGAGKSTILRAIEAALFAGVDRRGPSTDLEPMLGMWADRMEITLVFEHGGDVFRVRRGFKARGSATLDLEIEQSDVAGSFEPTWTPLTREDQKQTQAELERLIGLSRRTFRASSFLAQGDAGAFTEASAADRKAVLGEALDPRGLWAGLAKHSNERRRGLEQVQTEAGGRIATLDQIVADAPTVAADLVLARDEIDLAKASVLEAEEALDEAVKAQAENAAAAERVTAAKLAETHAVTTWAAALEAVDGARSEVAKLPDMRVLLAELEKTAATIPALEHASEEYRTAALRAEQARREKQAADEDVTRQRARVNETVQALAAAATTESALRDRLTHLEGAKDGKERCAVCEQTLGTEARAAAITNTKTALADATKDSATKRSAADQAAETLATLTEKAAAIEIPAVLTDDPGPSLAVAREAASRVELGLSRVTAAEETQTRLPGLEQTLVQANQARQDALATREQAERLAGDPAALTAAAEQARAALGARRASMDEVTRRIAALEERQRRVTEARTELDHAQERAGERALMIDTLRLGEKAFGRDGVPALLVEAAVPQIETEANRILERMPMGDGTALRVELITQVEQKTVDNLKETLDIRVSDGDTTRAYESFSGGEKERLNIALRVALARLLASRRGAEVELLAIDEIAGLDANGFAGLVSVLQDAESEFSRTMIVSHHPDLQLAFARQIQVVKRGGVSEVLA